MGTYLCLLKSIAGQGKGEELMVWPTERRMKNYENISRWLMAMGNESELRTIDVRRKNDRCMEQRRSETKQWRNADPMTEEKDG